MRSRRSADAAPAESGCERTDALKPPYPIVGQDGMLRAVVNRPLLQKWLCIRLELRLKTAGRASFSHPARPGRTRMGSTATRPRLDCEAVVREKRREKKSAMVQYLAQEFRIKVLDILHDRGTGHWGGASSAAELLVALYFDAMNIRPDDLKWPDRDRLVVSKGHASCMLYTVLANRGYFPVEELATFRQLDSRLQGHPCMRTTPGGGGGTPPA